MADITLFEFHTHGSQIGPSSLPGIGRGETTDDATTTAYADVEEDEDDGGLGLLPMVLVAGVLLVLGVLARKKFTGDEETETVPLAESDEISPTPESPPN